MVAEDFAGQDDDMGIPYSEDVEQIMLLQDDLNGVVAEVLVGQEDLESYIGVPYPKDALQASLAVDSVNP